MQKVYRRSGTFGWGIKATSTCTGGLGVGHQYMYWWPRAGATVYIHILVASGSRRGGGFAGLRQLLSNRMRNRRQQHLQYAHACFGSRCCTATRKGSPFARQRFSLVRCFGFVCFGVHCFGFCLGTCWLLRLLLLWLRGTGGHGSSLWNSTSRATRK